MLLGPRVICEIPYPYFWPRGLLGSCGSRLSSHRRWWSAWKSLPPANARIQTGKVSTERQFVGEPVIHGSYEIDLRRTDGKAKNDLIVKICFVDQNGNDVKFEKVRLNKDGRTSFKKTFTGVEGTFPLIHLNNEKWGLNAHEYRLRAEASGEPAALVKARKTVAEAPEVRKVVRPK